MHHPLHTIKKNDQPSFSFTLPIFSLVGWLFRDIFLCEQHEVFDVFRAKLDAIGMSKGDMGKLFKEIDTDNSGEVDSKELRKGLAVMGVHISGQRYKRLFRVVDKDRGGTISFKEFFQLVYPDDEDMPELSPRK